MSITGVDKQMASVPELMKSVINQESKKWPSILDAENKEIQALVVKAFDASEIIRCIKIQVQENISESNAKYLFVWYESELGRKITKAEENASTTAGYQEMMKNAQILLADKKRVVLANQIENLINTTDMALQMQENTGVAIVIATAALMNPGQALNIQAVRTQMAARFEKTRASVRQMIILSFVYSYKDIGITSIEKYISFLEKPSTRDFNKHMMYGIQYAFNQSINKMAAALAPLMKQRAENGK